MLLLILNIIYLLQEYRRCLTIKNLSSKGIRFSGDSIKSCVCFIDLVDSTKNTITIKSISKNQDKQYDIGQWISIILIILIPVAALISIIIVRKKNDRLIEN